MLQLKEYQQRSLDALDTYFRRTVQLGDADTAFYQTTREVRERGVPYRPVEELPGLPYVCLRVPTGGGKTLMAAHAVGTATRSLLEADRSVVLWLVPTSAILEQTLSALKDPAHPYREAVENEVGEVEVLNVEEALSVTAGTLGTSTTIIVSTMQAFRVEDTEGRKVYEDAGALMDHFSDLPNEAKDGLETLPETETPKRSLANVLRLHRPAVIVDEAHNARTDLSFETLARFDPSCIIEFTATPAREDHASNVLHSVSAAELKAEKMIKLPIELTTRPRWQELLSDAIEQRALLEQEAAKEERQTGEYIRPVMLIKAEANRGSDPLTADVVEACLREDFGIPEEEIARATGSNDDLEDADILSEDCPIRYVITIQKLQEGWDCPFAYVLCSVAAMRSNRAVEQIVGRVLRMPQVREKEHDALNRAYAFSADEDFGLALNAVRDVLVENGFEKQEAETMVEGAAQQSYGPLFEDPPPASSSDAAVEIKLSEAPSLGDLPSETAEKVDVDPERGTLTYEGGMDEAERDQLKRCFREPESQENIEEAYRKVQSKTGAAVRAPVEEGKPMEVPQLLIRRGGQYEVFEKSHVLNTRWKLSECDPTLPAYEGMQRAGKRGTVDVSEEGSVQTEFLDTLHRQQALLANGQDWTTAELIHWLDRTIPHQDIRPREAHLYFSNLIRHLTGERDFTLKRLVRDKYRLRRRVEERIQQHREQAHENAYLGFLDPEDGDTPLAVRPDVCFSFPNEYPYNRLYDGGHTFHNHYYPQIGDFDSGEEERCAQFIDRLPPIDYWVRNLDRRPRHAFWLQTSTDRFYPDFVCRLRDERYLVVEYKGADRWSDDDSHEKRTLGELWAERSDGQCLFVMPKGPDHDTIRAEVG